jgi:hypothetical protein
MSVAAPLASSLRAPFRGDPPPKFEPVSLSDPQPNSGAETNARFIDRAYPRSGDFQGAAAP